MELTTAEFISKLISLAINLWKWLGTFCWNVLTKDVYEFVSDAGAVFGTTGVSKFINAVLSGITGGIFEDVPFIVFLLCDAVVVWIAYQIVKLVLSIFKLFI